MEKIFYKCEQIEKGVFLIRDLLSDYMYVVEGEKKAALIDTGMGFPGLCETVGKLTGKPVIVLNTHGHLDHIGGNDEFETVMLHPADYDVYEIHRKSSYRKDVITGMIKELGVDLSQEVVQQLICDRKKRKISPVPSRIDLGGRCLETLYTPGHTKGSVCFYDRENKILFSGDTVCSMGVMLNFSESVPVEEFMKSIEFLKKQVTGCETICPGHHKVPLDFSYFEKYLECGKRVLAHPGQGEWEKSACGKFRRLHYDDVSLTYQGEQTNRRWILTTYKEVKE